MLNPSRALYEQYFIYYKRNPTDTQYTKIKT